MDSSEKYQFSNCVHVVRRYKLYDVLFQKSTETVCTKKMNCSSDFFAFLSVARLKVLITVILAYPLSSVAGSSVQAILLAKY